MAEEQPIPDVLKLLGISAGNLQKVKLGSGAVSKLMIIAVAALLALAVGLARAGSAMVTLVGIVAVFLVCLAAFAAVIYVVINKPELAVMEGMEFVRYKQLMIGAKDFKPETELPPVPDPGLPPLDNGGMK